MTQNTGVQVSAWQEILTSDLNTGLRVGNLSSSFESKVVLGHVFEPQLPILSHGKKVPLEDCYQGSEN